MRFTITHPMHSHPYKPEFVSGEGIGRVAAAIEAAGIHGFGFTDHPAPSQRWLEAGGHDAGRALRDDGRSDECENHRGEGCKAE